jgi:hypothetical protein
MWRGCSSSPFIKSLSEWTEYASNEHFSVDGTLIDAWASHKSFVKKDGGEPPKPVQRLQPFT